MKQFSNANGQIISVNGIELYFEIHGTGAPLLLLHGFTGSGAALLPAFKELTKDHQLIIPDLRGHGRSTNPSNKFTHREAAADIFGLLDHLKLDSCYAIGFSAGGNILLHMAIQQPHRIKSMAVVSATPYFPEASRTIMKLPIEDASNEAWEAMRKIHYHGDEQIKMLWTQANAFSTSHDDMNLTIEDLSKISTKTFIVQGDRDPLYPIEISIEMYRNISDSYLWVIPNGGHVPLSNETIPEFINYLRSLM